MLVFFENIVANFRWLDFIDISIISIIIYFIARWAVETTSRYVLIGLLAVLSIYVIGRTFDLYLTTLFFNGLVTILTFAIVVIFQDDIRRMLERLARAAGRRGGRRVSIADPQISGLVESISWLANRRIGCLIVVTGRDSIERLIEGGVLLDGEISKALLVSLFDPNSPGHDGAVVIGNRRIEKFAVHLPLTKNRHLVGDRGTRHSAAIGLSELSDALVMIVSEETGEISVAKNGELKCDISAIDLQESLSRFLEDQSEQGGAISIRRAITARAGLKIGAVVLAALAWLAVVYQPGKVLRSMDVPIEYRGIKPELVLERVAPEKVGVTFLGLAGSINLLDPARVRLNIDLEPYREGEHRIRLGPENVSHPTNVSVFDMEPDYIRVTILKFEQAELEIVPRLRGAPAEGFQVRSVETNPSRMRAMVLSPYDSAQVRVSTLPVDVQGLRSSKTFETKIEIPNHVKVQDAGLLAVLVTVRIEPKRTVQPTTQQNPK